MQLPVTSPLILGQALREARVQKGLSQAELGKLVNIAQTRISLIERGGVTGNLDTILRITAALDLEIVLQPKAKSPKTAW